VAVVVARVRSRRLKTPSGLDLSPEHELELIFGPHPVRGSVFASVSDRRAAVVAFEEVVAARAEHGGKLLALFVRWGHEAGRAAWDRPDDDEVWFERAISYLTSAEDLMVNWLRRGRPTRR